MTIKRAVKTKVENILGIHVFRELPFGVNTPHDILKRFPDYRLNTIFDVGANVGQSALSYLSTYPTSTIYCFEPITETYKQLVHNTSSNDQVFCFNLALGASPGRGAMKSEGVSPMNCLVPEGSDSNVENLESVNVSTLDAFCEANDISKIGYLKIDTEGGDLDVLKGAKGLLSANSIDIVEVEAGMNPGNKHHVPFESLKSLLEDHAYFIFGIYQQFSEWNNPHLRRTNTVFISEKMIRLS